MLLSSQSSSNDDSQSRQLCVNKRLTKAVSSVPRARFQKARPNVPNSKRPNASSKPASSFQLQTQRSALTEKSEEIENNKEVVNVNDQAQEGIPDINQRVERTQKSAFEKSNENQCAGKVVNTDNQSQEIVPDTNQDAKKTEKSAVLAEKADEKQSTAIVVKIDDQQPEVVHDTNQDAKRHHVIPTNEPPRPANNSSDSTKSQILQMPDSSSPAKHQTIQMPDSSSHENCQTLQMPDSSSPAKHQTLQIYNSSSPAKSQTLQLPDLSSPEKRQTLQLPDLSSPEKRQTLQLPDLLSPAKRQTQHTSESCKITNNSVPNHQTEEKGENSPNVSSSTTDRASKYPHLTSILSKKRSEPKKDTTRRRKKYKTGDVPERSKMTMADLIYWNPTSKSDLKNQESSTIEVPISNNEEAEECEEEVEQQTEEDNYNSVPKLILSEDGNINLDLTSLFVPKKIVQPISKVIINEETTYASYRKRPMNKHWTPKDTTIFYKALSLVGTDFGLMEKLLPQRTRRELKLKFKREERYNIELINKAMYESHLTFDAVTLEEHIEKLNSLSESNSGIVEDKNQSSKKGSKKQPGKNLKSKKVLSDSKEYVENTPHTGSKKQPNKKCKSKKVLSESEEYVEKTPTCKGSKKQPGKNLKKVLSDSEEYVENTPHTGSKKQPSKKRKSKKVMSESEEYVEKTPTCKGSKKRKSKKAPSDSDEYVEKISTCKSVNNGDISCKRKRKEKKLPEGFIDIDEVEDITDLVINEVYDADSMTGSSREDINTDENQPQPEMTETSNDYIELNVENLYDDSNNVEILYVEENADFDLSVGVEASQAIAENASTILEIINPETPFGVEASQAIAENPSTILEIINPETPITTDIFLASPDVDHSEIIAVTLSPNSNTSKNISPLINISNEVVTSQTVEVEHNVLQVTTQPETPIATGLILKSSDDDQKEKTTVTLIQNESNLKDIIPVDNIKMEIVMSPKRTVGRRRKVFKPNIPIKTKSRDEICKSSQPSLTNIDNEVATSKKQTVAIEHDALHIIAQPDTLVATDITLKSFCDNQKEETTITLIQNESHLKDIIPVDNIKKEVVMSPKRTVGRRRNAFKPNIPKKTKLADNICEPSQPSFSNSIIRNTLQVDGGGLLCAPESTSSVTSNSVLVSFPDEYESKCVPIDLNPDIPMAEVVANEVVSSEKPIVRRKRKANVPNILKKTKITNELIQPAQPSIFNYTPREDFLQINGKKLQCTPRTYSRTYSKSKMATPESQNVLISSLQTPLLTPEHSNSLLTTLNMSNNQPIAIPMTPDPNDSSNSVMIFAKSPNTDNIFHLFMYKNPVS